MNNLPSYPLANGRLKAQELGIPEGMIASALQLISSSRNMINAMDHPAEMDDYIYQSIIRQSCEQRKQKAEQDLLTGSREEQIAASGELTLMSREELVTDPYYRAVLPLLIKVMNGAPILKLHADEASSIVLQLADCKRRNRAASFTEVIVKKCSGEISGILPAGISAYTLRH
jgi:hypothetical protein